MEGGTTAARLERKGKSLHTPAGVVGVTGGLVNYCTCFVPALTGRIISGVFVEGMQLRVQGAVALDDYRHSLMATG